jgi:cysteine desulfurase
VAHLTGNFTAEAPLSPAVREAISAGFEQGWSDPKKLSQASARARILTDTALSEIAEGLSTRRENLEVIGEPALLPYISLNGFLRQGCTLITSMVDVGKIRAVARNHQGNHREAKVDSDGAIILENESFTNTTVVSLQASNGETGISQDIDRYRSTSAAVVIDATTALPEGDFVSGFSATTFASTSFGGPSGIGFIAITEGENFRYPLPHIAPIRVPGTFNLPLLLGSAIALTEFKRSLEDVVLLRKQLKSQIGDIPGVTAIGKDEHSSHLSFLIDSISSEEFLRTLLQKELALDAGSACSPEDLTPSHVIASMGLPTTGHLRMTVHPGMTNEDIDNAVRIIRDTVGELSS